MSITLITYDGHPAAFLTARTVRFAPHIKALPVGSPVRRFVAVCCLYERLIREGRLAGPYRQCDAEDWARRHLLPERRFLELVAAGHDDDQLEQLTGVPTAHVERRRLELRRRPTASDCRDR